MSPTWHLTDPPDEVALLRARVSHLAMRLDEARDDIDAQAHALTAHAVGWVTAAERLGLEVREEEPEQTRARVLAALCSGRTGSSALVGEYAAAGVRAGSTFALGFVQQVIAEARDEVLHSTGVYEPNDVLAILDGISDAIEPEAP